MYGLQYLVCILSFTMVVLSAQGALNQVQSGKQLPWTNCGESILLHTHEHALSLINMYVGTGTENYVLKFNSLTLDPYPLQLGHKYYIYLSGLFSK